MSERLKTISLAAALFLINAYVVRELFTTEYTMQMGSIEAAFISIARYVTENWRDLTWFPLWYGGIPYQNSYSPLLHLTVAATAKLSGASPALAYHAVTAAMYCLGPVTLFWLAWKLSRSRTYSFAAALLYSLFSPSALLASVIRHDLGGVFNPRRLQALIQYGEGPHTTSMTLLPVAILCLHNALEKRRPVHYLLAALSMVAVVLTNWLGGFALAAAVLAYLLARAPRSNWKTWATAAGIGIYAYVIASPWIPPSTIAAVRANAQYVGGDFRMTVEHLKYAGLVLVALVGVEYALARWKPPELLRFALVFLFFTAALTLTWAWAGIALMPQPERYHLEMEMALALVVAFAFKPLLESMGGNRRAFLAAGFLLFAFFQVKTYRGYAKYHARPIDIRTTLEYKAAQWFDRNMQGRRVYAPAAVSFWMNAFTDTPQYGGGFDQGMTNRNEAAVAYQVYTGEGADKEGEVAAAWLRAFGVHAVMTGGPKSASAYKPFRNARKFEGLFKEVWREGDDAIYEIPARSRSLAHVVRTGDLPSRKPAGGLDIEPLAPYLAALENPALPLADFRWRNRHEAEVSAGFGKGDLLSVQISHHPGWRATVAGQPRRAYSDNLGQLVIEPGCTGPCTVNLSYDGGLEMLVARLLSWAALIAGLALAAMQERRLVLWSRPQRGKRRLSV